MNADDSVPDQPESPEAPAAPAAARAPSSAPETATPADLRVPWTWLDLLLLGILALAGSLLLTLGLASVFRKLGVTPAQFHTPSVFGTFTLVHQGLLFALVLAYLVAQVRYGFREPFWRTIGWHGLEPARMPGALRYAGFVVGGFALALLVEVVSLQFGTKAKLPVQVLFQDRRIAVAVALMAVFVAPVIEETVFRGYIYPVVARSFGVTAGVLGTGLLFGLLHAPQLWGGWVQICMLVLVGIVFSYARAVWKSVLASFLLHISYNFFISFGLAILMNGLRLLSAHH